MNDLISRQEAITLGVMPKEYRKYQTYNLDDAYEQGWLDLQKCIEKLPPVTIEPERKRGKWIWDDFGYHCSECFYNPVGSDEIFFGEYKFCPHCGAEMEGEEDAKT